MCYFGDGKREMDKIKMFRDDELIGVDKDEAIKRIKAAGLIARINKEEGQVFIGSMDMRDDRVNLTILDGKIVNANRG